MIYLRFEPFKELLVLRDRKNISFSNIENYMSAVHLVRLAGIGILTAINDRRT